MPRTNPTRSLPYEAHVAANVARERERQGMTYEGLAHAMTVAGCPIQPSAIFKIEKGQPPRRITVNELWALSASLKIGPMELLEDPDQKAPPEMWQLVHEVEDHQRTIERALHEIQDVVARMHELVTQDPKVRTFLRRYLAEGWGDWPEVRDRFKSVLRPSTSSTTGAKP